MEKTTFKEDKVYINETQYFNNVNKELREYLVGGYSLAQKWLKDRKGELLPHSIIEHYSLLFV